MFAFLTRNPGPIKLLLVEDSVGDTMLMKDALNESGANFEIEHVDRLSLALERLADREFDVVVLDLGLPDSMGLETLLKTHRAAPDVPIVVLTGVSDETLSMKALENGAQDYLVKGLTEGDLLVHSICHAIERHQLRERLNEVRRQQIENQKLESLAMLAGGIAYDFNNLLTVMMGKSEMIYRRPGITPAIKESLDQIRNAGGQATELCKQLLAYSGKGKTVLLLYNPSVVIQEMAHHLERAVPSHINLKYQLAQQALLVKMDLAQLRQLIVNLVQNAAEAIGPKEGTIAISTSLVHADGKYLEKTLLADGLTEGDYVCLEVADTGCGMDTATREKIFEPFFTTKNEGRGLGLPAVHGIVRACKGTMEVISEKGRGTTISILLPCTRSGPTVAPEPKKHVAEWKGRGTVLVVEDDKGIREVLSEMIKEMGFKVLLAGTGAEGVECFGQHTKDINLVLVDMVMPQMNGDQVVKKIRRIKPDVKVLLMSGYVPDETQIFSNGKSRAGFIQKPFQFADLREKIHSLLKN